MSEPELKPLGWRTDIQGLRAIAILLVVAAHAHVPSMDGGFIGVDVFFVLSGFLITGLLLHEAQASHGIDLTRFYARRLKRLAPGLAVTLLVTLVFASLLLGPFQQRDQAMSMASAALWVSNLFFGFSEFGYFDGGAASNLVLHTWSLGVEEQFYLLWPLLIACAFGLWPWRRRPSETNAVRRLCTTMILVLIASFALSLWWTSTHPALGFYMMPARAWQFALGGLACIASSSRVICPHAAHDRRISWLPITVGWSGMAGLGFAAILINAETPYPGFAALLPSTCTAAILVANADSGTRSLDRLLSLPPLQWIGDRSYAWYLWHWPIMLLGSTLLDSTSLGNRLILVGISLALASASFRYVEAPMRQSKRLSHRPSAVITWACAAMAAICVATIQWQTWAENALLGPTQQRLIRVRSDYPRIYAAGCDEWIHGNAVRLCEFGPAKATRTAVIVGDSIGLQWFPALAKVFEERDWKLIAITKSSCPIIDESAFTTPEIHVHRNCVLWRKKMLTELTALNADMIIIGSSDRYPYTSAQWELGTRSIVDRLAGHAGQIRLLRATPQLNVDGPSCLSQQSWLQWLLPNWNSCWAPSADPHNQAVFDGLHRAIATTPNAKLIDMNELVCPDGLCKAEFDGQIVFRDNQHLTASFASSLASDLESQLELEP